MCEYFKEKKDFIMFCVFHKDFEVRSNTSDFVYFGVNETFVKNIQPNVIVVLEYELEKYCPFLQKRGYMETSAYLHVYWNKLYTEYDMIGICQYDMIHQIDYTGLNNQTIYMFKTGQPIALNENWNSGMFADSLPIDFLLNSYNRFFNTQYSISLLENIPFSLWQTNIYPVRIYEKLCKWLEVLVKEIYPWSNMPPYKTHFGSVGEYTERALSIFNAFEILEGTKHEHIGIWHLTDYGQDRVQYNKNAIINYYCQDIHTKKTTELFESIGNTNVNYITYCDSQDNVIISEHINNFIHYKDEYYISFIHMKNDTIPNNICAVIISKISNNGDVSNIEYQVSYVSKPIMFYRNKNHNLNAIENTNILHYSDMVPSQSVFFKENNKYYIVICTNIQTKILYELDIDIPL
jgi:hypothetical protein